MNRSNVFLAKKKNLDSTLLVQVANYSQDISLWIISCICLLPSSTCFFKIGSYVRCWLGLTDIGSCLVWNRVTDMWTIRFVTPHVSDPKSSDVTLANLSPCDSYCCCRTILPIIVMHWFVQETSHAAIFFRHRDMCSLKLLAVVYFQKKKVVHCCINCIDSGLHKVSAWFVHIANSWPTMVMVAHGKLVHISGVQGVVSSSLSSFITWI